MRITESRLRKVIRQVIKEAVGDYDTTDMSSRIRNQRIEDEHQGSYTDRRMAMARAEQDRQQQVMDQQQRMQSFSQSVIDILEKCQKNKSALESCNIDPMDGSYGIDTDDYHTYNNFTLGELPEGSYRNIGRAIAGCLGLDMNDDDVLDAAGDAVFYALEHADSVHGQNSCLSMEAHGDLILTNQKRLVEFLCNPATQTMVR